MLLEEQISNFWIFCSNSKGKSRERKKDFSIKMKVTVLFKCNLTWPSACSKMVFFKRARLKIKVLLHHSSLGSKQPILRAFK